LFVCALPSNTGARNLGNNYYRLSADGEGRSHSVAYNVIFTPIVVDFLLRNITFNALAMVKVLNRNFLCASILAVALALSYKYWSVSDLAVA